MDELRQSGKFIRGLSSVQKAVAANWNVTIQGSGGFSKIPEVTSRSSDMPTHRNLSECGDIEGAASPANVEKPTRSSKTRNVFLMTFGMTWMARVAQQRSTIRPADWDNLRSISWLKNPPPRRTDLP